MIKENNKPQIKNKEEDRKEKIQSVLDFIERAIKEKDEQNKGSQFVIYL